MINDSFGLFTLGEQKIESNNRMSIIVPNKCHKDKAEKQKLNLFPDSYSIKLY
jgi:hypothetical protein